MGQQKALGLGELILDAGNPRVEASKSQYEEIQKLLDDQGEDLLSLAEDILEHGMSPIERLLVMPDKVAPERYVVLEGNRRLLALRLMTNPSMLGGMQIASKLQSQFEELASEFKKRQPVKGLDCYVVNTRDEARHWILLRHTGANDGAGVVNWTAVASARFKGEDAALQVLDFVSRFGNLTSEEKALVMRRDFPITTLDRLLNSRAVRELLGFSVKKNKLISGLPPDELMKPLKKIVLDLGSKRVRVSRLMKTADQIDYVKKEFSPDEKPSLSHAGDIRTIADFTEADFRKEPEKKNPRKIADPSDRRTVAPRSPRLNVSVAKVAEIYKELQKLRVDEFPHACAVMLRVFLELSVDHYCETNSIPLEDKGRNGNKFDKQLGKKVQEAIDQLVKSGANRKHFAAVVRGLSVDHSPLNIYLLNQYVHNRFVKASERELKSAWDQAHPFFEKIWA